MRHGIPFFDNTESEGWGITWLLSGLVTVITIVFGIATGIAALYAPTALFVLFSYGIFGHHFWPLTTNQIERWKSYQNLPAEHRKQIGLTRKEFAGMTDKQRGDVATKVNDLHQIINNRNDGLTIPAELRTRFAAVLENEKSAWEHEKAAKAKMKELGWDE